MTTVGNISTQLKSIIGSGFNGGEIELGNGSKIDIGNILNGSAYGIEAFSGNGSSEQKASAIQGLANTIMSLLEKLCGNEAKTAKKEVDANKKASDNFDKEAEKSRQEIQKKISDIGVEVENQSTIVKDSITKLEESDKKIQEKQEEINRIISEIAEKQQELAKTNDSAKQAEILQTIKGLSVQITAQITSIGDIQKNIEAASTNVENAVTEIETAKGNSVEITDENEMKITQLVQEGAKNLQDTVNSDQTGKTNNATGDELQKAAEAAANNVLSGSSIAPKLYNAANDQKTAGSTRTAGAVANLQKVLQGIGGLNDNISLLNQFTTSIGGALSSFEGNIGSWNTSLDSTITSIGSFDTIKEENTTLQSNVSQDASSIGYNVTEEGKLEKSEDEAGDNYVEQKLGADFATTQSKLTSFEIKKKQ